MLPTVPTSIPGLKVPSTKAWLLLLSLLTTLLMVNHRMQSPTSAPKLASRQAPAPQGAVLRSTIAQAKPVASFVANATLLK